MQEKEVKTIQALEEQEAIEETALAIASVALPDKGIVDEALERARYIAKRLLDIARDGNMTFTIETKSGERVEGLRVDGWRLLASWLGYGIATEITNREYDENRRLIRVHAKAYLLKGGVVHAYAEGVATRWDNFRGRVAENGVGRWAEATDDVLESVAQTNAVTEVCKQNLGFIVRMAGIRVEEAPPKIEPVKEEELTQKDWGKFWLEVRKLGFSREDLHELYGVESMKEVIKSRKDMEQILSELKAI